MEKQRLVEVVSMAKHGDKSALQTLYIDTYKSVYYFALSLVRNPQDAEDFTQEVFIKVCEKISELREPAAFYKWVNQITVNQCNTLFRKYKRMGILDNSDDYFAQVADDDPNNLPDKAIDNEATRKIIYDVINALPENQRVCVILHYYSQFPVKGIASMLEISENTVKTRLSLARKKIRAALEMQEKREGIRLYGVPIALTPILGQAMGRLPMSSGAQERIWGNVANTISGSVPLITRNGAEKYEFQGNSNPGAGQNNNSNNDPGLERYGNRGSNYNIEGFGKEGFSNHEYNSSHARTVNISPARKQSQVGTRPRTSGAAKVLKVAGISLTKNALIGIAATVAVVIFGAVLISQTGSLAKISINPESDFIATDTDGGVSIAKYSGSATEVNIPSVIRGSNVVRIGNSAFKERSAITKIIIPDTVTRIGEEAFAGCSSLTYIRIPNSVTEIGWGAFNDCTDLEQVSIPDSIGRLGHTNNVMGTRIPSVFLGCINLTNVTYKEISYSVTTVTYGSRELYDLHDEFYDAVNGDIQDALIANPDFLITIPDFVGHRYDVIINNEEYAKLYTFNNPTFEANKDVPEGQIILQDPAAGRERKMPLSGERINIRLTVSSGE